MRILNYIRSKFTKEEKLPPQYRWRENNEQLFCMTCYPSHTIPFLGFDLEDDNIKNFMTKHADCKPYEEKSLD